VALATRKRYPCVAIREEACRIFRTCVLWALVVGGVGLPSCGGPSRTCLERIITYTGSKSGTAYLRVASDDGGRSLFIGSSAASIQFLISVESGSATCYGDGQPIDIPITATAWIDVSGSAAANCSDMHNAQCQPSLSDPQAQQSAVLRFGQLTRIHLDVVDPP
jgi:hypothetical protein